MRAVLFDLDGTLLDLDIDRFMPRYLSALAEAFSSLIEPDPLKEAVLAGTAAMIANDGSTTNEDAFWTVFEEKTGLDRTPLLPLTDRFYREVFPGLSSVARKVEAAPRVVEAAKESGAIVVLATNAIFPEVAIIERLRWAGVDPAVFDLITSYETMHASKPNPEYYLEICRLVGIEPHQAVMIGNDPELDVRAAQSAGMSAYLVDDGTPAGAMEQEFAQRGPGDASKTPVSPDGKGPLVQAITFFRGKLTGAR